MLCLPVLNWCLDVLKHICHQHHFISHIRRRKGALRLHFWHYVKSVIEHVCLGAVCVHVCASACLCVALCVCVGGSSCCLVTSLRLTKEEQFRNTFHRNQYNRPDVMM